MTDLPAALRSFLAEAHDGAQIGALLAVGVLIAACVWLGVRRAFWRLPGHPMTHRRSPSHWRGH